MGCPLLSNYTSACTHCAKPCKCHSAWYRRFSLQQYYRGPAIVTASFLSCIVWGAPKHQFLHFKCQTSNTSLSRISPPRFFFSKFHHSRRHQRHDQTQHGFDIDRLDCLACMIYVNSIQHRQQNRKTPRYMRKPGIERKMSLESLGLFRVVLWWRLACRIIAI